MNTAMHSSALMSLKIASDSVHVASLSQAHHEQKADCKLLQEAEPHADEYIQFVVTQRTTDLDKLHIRNQPENDQHRQRSVSASVARWCACQMSPTAIDLPRHQPLTCVNMCRHDGRSSIVNAATGTSHCC